MIRDTEGAESFSHNAGGIRRRVYEVIISVISFGLLDLGRRSLIDENGFALPHHRDSLAERNRAQINFNSSKCRNIGARIHVVNKWPEGSSRANGSERAPRYNQKTTPVTAR